MGSARGFFAQFFPLFLLGALFGKLMEDSGSVTAIADFMTEKLGPSARDPGGRAGGRARHLWRRQPVRRLLRAGADGADAVPRGRHSAPADAGGDRARHLDLHHVGAAGHARRSRTRSRCRSSAPRRSPRRASASSPSPIMLGFGLWWLQPRGGRGAARGEGFGDGGAADAPSARRRRDRARARHHRARVRSGGDRATATTRRRCRRSRSPRCRWSS